MGKRVFKYGTRIAFRETINGSLWITAGAFGIFDNQPCKFISVVLLALALLSQTFAIWGKFEKTDEMAAANLNVAKAITLDYIRILIMVIYIALLIIPNDVVANLDWGKIIYPALILFIGLPEVITGLLFNKIEEE